MHDIKER